jgi:FkbM family methyltransferase
MNFIKKIVNKLLSIFNNIAKNLHQNLLNLLTKGIDCVEYNGEKMYFFKPNWVNKYRIKTFSTKEPGTLDWIDSIPEGAILWDIGANVGLYSIYAAKKRKCQVLAFEPSVFNLEWLARNINENSLQESINIVPLALSNNNSFNVFNMKNTDWGGALSTYGESYDEKGFNFDPVFQYGIAGVAADEIPALFNTINPDYLKIDVDGIEHLILEGSTKILLTVKSLLIEIDDGFEEQAALSEKYLLKAGLHLKQKNWLVGSQHNQIWAR